MFLRHSFGWMVGWVGGWSWYWVGTHRVEFLLENMNGASPLFQLSLLLPLIQSADGQNPGDHAGTRVFPLVWQKKELLYGVDMQNIQFKLPSISLWFLHYQEELGTELVWTSLGEYGYCLCRLFKAYLPTFAILSCIICNWVVGILRWACSHLVGGRGGIFL